MTDEDKGPARGRPKISADAKRSKLSVTLPKDLIKQARGLSEATGLSQFVEKAIAKEIERTAKKKPKNK